MAFRNFVYSKDEEDLSFLPMDPSPGFGIGSPSTSVNIEPFRGDEEPVLQPVEVTTDSGRSHKPELFVVHPRSVATQIKDRKCKTRVGSSRPPVKRKLASRSSNSCATRAKTSTLKDDVLFLTVSNDDEGELPSFVLLSIVFVASKKNHLDNHMDVELLDLHELLAVIKKRREECNVASLEVEKARLEAVEVSLRKEVDDVKRDMMEIFSKVVPYATIELIYSHDRGSLVDRLVSSAIFYEICKALE
nr:hypothetical protein [Tanacetum cinerariifolium]